MTLSATSFSIWKINPVRCTPAARVPWHRCFEGSLMSCPRNKHIFPCDQNGPPARRSEPDWQLESAYLNRYVTDEQQSRRPIFIATLWAAASWLFFRVVRSSRIVSDMLVATASPARTALKNSQLTCGERHAYFGDRRLR